MELEAKSELQSQQHASRTHSRKFFSNQYGLLFDWQSVAKREIRMSSQEERIIARGLRHPGPLLILKKRLRDIEAIKIRRIVSDRESADEIVQYLSSRGARCDIDKFENEYHVVADLSKYRDVQ